MGKLRKEETGLKLQRTDRRALLLWRMRLSLGVLICPFIIALFFPAAPIWEAVLTILWIVFYLFMFLIYYPVKYAKLRYTVTDANLVIHCGVFYNRVKAMQLQNIQHVSTGATPLARALGLCSVQVWGAGGVLYLPGLKRQVGAALCGRLTRPAKGEKK